MNQDVQVLDVVALTEDIPDRSLVRGQVGTVVEAHGLETFEVEFVDNEGKTTRCFHSNPDNSSCCIISPRDAGPRERLWPEK